MVVVKKNWSMAFQQKQDKVNNFSILLLLQKLLGGVLVLVFHNPSAVVYTTHSHTRSRTRTHPHMLMHSHTPTHAHTLTHAHSLTHTCTCIYTHNFSIVCNRHYIDSRSKCDGERVWAEERERDIGRERKRVKGRKRAREWEREWNTSRSPWAKTSCSFCGNSFLLFFFYSLRCFSSRERRRKKKNNKGHAWRRNTTSWQKTFDSTIFSQRNWNLIIFFLL